ncbi:MAG: ACP phosphodiesterase [Bacteroidales bacterium]
MNYLAHLFLSGNDEEVIIGNFIGDYVKGHNFNNYSENIKKGILMHRNIDMFTDTNRIARASKSRFASVYGKYAGIIIDILYDHYLALKWNLYSGANLEQFVDEIHAILMRSFKILPEEVQSFIPSFINNNWLNTYKSIEGIEIVLDKMSKRTSLPDKTKNAIKIFREEYDFIEEEFLAFFPTLMDFVTKRFGIAFSSTNLNYSEIC